MSWINAIKAHALTSGGKYTIPKKDTPEYEAIKAIQAKMASEAPDASPDAVKVRKPRAPKVATVAVDTPVEILGCTCAAPEKKPKKVKVVNVVPEVVTVVAPVEVKVKKVKTEKVSNDKPVIRRKRVAKIVEGVRLDNAATTVSFE